MRRLGGAIVALTAAVASAQPVPCEECARGNAQLDALGAPGATLRANLGLLAEAERMNLEQEMLTKAQDERLKEWHKKLPAIVKNAIGKLGKKTDSELLDIGFALCGGNEINCARHLALALHCTTRTCEVEPEPPRPLPRNLESPSCDSRVEGPSIGMGFEYGEGWQSGKSPAEGRVVSFGFELRHRLSNLLGVVTHISYSHGRDASIDEDGDGHDDISTGAVERGNILFGPSLMVMTSRGHEFGRTLQLDLLGGVWTGSDESFVVGADLSYQAIFMRFGIRALQSVEIGEARMIVGHWGIGFGANPEESFGSKCGLDDPPRGSAWALGFDLPVVGYATELAWITPGFGLEGAYHINRFDGLLHADVLVMPNGDKERSLFQSVLGGGRFDLDPLFVTLLAGYSAVSAPSSSPIQSGVVADASVGWWSQADDAAVQVRLHARVGLTPEIRDLFAVFLSAGFELRLDRRRWIERARHIANLF